MGEEKLIGKHGGYRRLKSFQVAQLVYDITVRFCEKYVDPHSRTKDQMVQAARSGVQNIAEGSEASATSKKTEIKLTQVARASLEELKRDYEDFLRHRRLPQWQRDDPRRQSLVDRRCQSADEVAAWIVEQVKALQESGPGGPSGPSGRSGQGRPREQSTPSTATTASTPSTSSTPSTPIPPATLRTRIYPEYSANAALVLIAVACSLLDRQVAALAKRFEEEGGFTERMYRVRTSRRNRPRPK